MPVKQSHSAERTGKYTCTRCGWAWTPRLNSPDPPRACARCRSAYWQSAPTSSRANTPNDPKWQMERESVARRRQRRHYERLRALAAEFNLAVPDSPAIALSLTGAPNEPPHPLVGVDPRTRFNEPDLPRPSRPWRSLSEELRRRIAESKRQQE